MSGSPSTTPSLRPTRPPRGLGVGVGGRGGGDWTRGLLLGPAVVLGPVVAPPLRGPWPDATNSSEGARALSAAALTREVGASGLRLAPVCVLASAFSVILLLGAAPSVLALASGGAGPRDAALGRWPPSRGVPSAAPGPTRPTFLRARVPSRPPPSQGKLGPWGCSWPACEPRPSARSSFFVQRRPCHLPAPFWCGAGPCDAAPGRWPPSRGVPSAAPGPTRPTFLRARVPSRPPPSQGKLGPWGCSWPACEPRPSARSSFSVQRRPCLLPALFSSRAAGPRGALTRRALPWPLARREHHFRGRVRPLGGRPHKGSGGHSAARRLVCSGPRGVTALLLASAVLVAWRMAWPPPEQPTSLGLGQR